MRSWRRIAIGDRATRRAALVMPSSQCHRTDWGAGPMLSCLLSLVGGLSYPIAATQGLANRLHITRIPSLVLNSPAISPHAARGGGGAASGEGRERRANRLRPGCQHPHRATPRRACLCEDWYSLPEGTRVPSGPGTLIPLIRTMLDNGCAEKATERKPVSIERRAQSANALRAGRCMVRAREQANPVREVVLRRTRGLGGRFLHGPPERGAQV